MNVHGAIRLTLVAIVGAALIAMVFATKAGQGEPDFLAYWSAARLLVTGENPYDPVALRTLGHETRPERGQDRGEPFASWNPPWLLVALWPLGLLPFDVATHVWMLVNIGLIGTASMLTWRLFTSESDRKGALLAMAVGLWFGPGLVTVLAGQTSSLVLIALVLNAWFLQTGHDRLAGATLLLAAIKPHIVSLVLLLAVCQALRHRRWQVLWGLLAAAVVSMSILSVVFPTWLSAYFRLISTYRFLFFLYSTPTMGGLAYALWQTNLFRYAGVLLLLFVPSAVRLADTRGWLTAMNVALLASLPLAVYGFNADQVVLLPAILQVISWLRLRELPKCWAWGIGGGVLIVCMASFGMLFIQPWQVHWFVSLPLALAGLYALAWKKRTAAPSGLAGEGAESVA